MVLFQCKAVIFDMDGVLIDSEPLWQTAQISCLKAYGIDITVEDCIQNTMGKRIDALARTWCRLYPLMVEPSHLAQEILSRVIVLVKEQGTALPGVYALLHALKESGYLMGLATSSSRVLLDTVLEKLEIGTYFDQTCSADDEPYGKPHPSVYLKAATLLGVDAEDCIVIEDSVTGMIAAKAAAMRTYIVSHSSASERFSIADKRFLSMEELLEERIALS